MYLVFLIVPLTLLLFLIIGWACQTVPSRFCSPGQLITADWITGYWTDEEKFTEMT